MSPLDISHANFLIDNPSNNPLCQSTTDTLECNPQDILFCAGNEVNQGNLATGLYREYGTQNNKKLWKNPNIFQNDYFTIGWTGDSYYALTHPTWGWFAYTTSSDPFFDDDDDETEWKVWDFSVEGFVDCPDCSVGFVRCPGSSSDDEEEELSTTPAPTTDSPTRWARRRRPRRSRRDPVRRRMSLASPRLLDS